ncbi:MAG: hypothetical protein K6A63_04165, partial [Acholeplasmatales bacterium]|nr:hypothetical protein [Acholeplasmatales bacterium]
ISAILIFISLKRENSEIKLIFKEIKSDKESVKNILSVGIPSGVQYAIFAISNMFIQSGINYFDHVTVEGISASTNIDSFIYEPIYAFYTAAASFISKNYGAGQKNRILKSYLISFTYAFSIALILGTILFFYGRFFLGLFTNSSEVIDAGMERLKVMGLVYCVSAFMDTTTAACRGLGKTLAPTVMVITGTCIFRIIWIYTVFAHYHTIESLFIVYVITWVITSIPEIIYFGMIYRRSTKNLVPLNA